jgi:hypothetical protein
MKVWRRWQSDRFAQALEDFQQWERDRNRYGVGAVALTFSLDRHWVIWISPELESLAIPF